MTRPKPKAKPIPTGDYPPGYFTAHIREHDWPPGWQPQIDGALISAQAAGVHAGRLATWRAKAEGKGWAVGTMPMPRTPSNPLPARQARRAD